MPSEMIPLDSLRSFQTLTLNSRPISAERLAFVLEGRMANGERGRWTPSPWISQDLDLRALPSVAIMGDLPWAAWRTFLSLCRPTDEVFYEIHTDEAHEVWVFYFVIARGEKFRRFLLTATRHDIFSWPGVADPFPPWGNPLSLADIDNLRGNEWCPVWPDDYLRQSCVLHHYAVPLGRTGLQEEDFYGVMWNTFTPFELLRPGDRLRALRQGMRDSAGTTVHADYLQVERESGLVSRILTFPVAYHFSTVEGG